MTDEKKQELFPYFAYTYSKQINPEKYGNLSSDEWQTAIQDSPEDIDQISQAAGQLADEDWDALDQQYSQEQPQENQAQYAAKGAKIKKLKSMKCGCGCNMVTVKEEGGKMSSKCACKCGGKIKHQKGGNVIPLKNDATTIAKNKERIKSRPAIATKDSTDELSENLAHLSMDSYTSSGDLKNQYDKKFDATASALTRQKNKGKSGFDANGFPKKQNGGIINNKKSNNMKENLGSIQSILDSFKKGGKMKCQNGGDLSPKSAIVAKNGSKAPKRITTENKSVEIETAKCGKKLAKKQVGGKVKASINTAASATSKLPKMNSQSGANSSTVPTNPDGSAKAPARIKKGQTGITAPAPKKNKLPIVNGKKVPDDGADYSVQGPANKSEKVKKSFSPKK